MNTNILTCIIHFTCIFITCLPYCHSIFSREISQRFLSQFNPSTPIINFTIVCYLALLYSL